MTQLTRNNLQLFVSKLLVKKTPKDTLALALISSISAYITSLLLHNVGEEKPFILPSYVQYLRPVN